MSIPRGAMVCACLVATLGCSDDASDAGVTDASSRDVVTTDVPEDVHDAAALDAVDVVTRDAPSQDTADVVTADTISADTVTTDTISVDAISSDAVTTDTISTDAISADAVTTDTISTDASTAPCVIAAGASVADALAALRACPAGTTAAVADDRAHRELDVLFLVDNSPSMAPKQRALAANIATFLDRIDATGADYHLGVATSDVGTWTAPRTPWSLPLGACNSYEGDDGALQRVACTARSGLTATALAACGAVCPDDRFVPSGGAAFIAKTHGVTNVPAAMVGGVDVGPQRAFQCMALVGDGGCGVEGQLEGMRRALDGHNPANAGFLRPSSLLAVVMLTDEDDCSVSPAGRAENNPVTTSCPAADPNAAASCFNPDYRCIARDVVCDEALNTPGAKHHCTERATSYLNPVSPYAAFLRGLRPANRVVFGGIWTAPSLQSGGAFNVSYSGSTMLSSDLNRALGADAACVSASDVTVVGRPQVRLSALASQLPGSVEASVCDTAHYGDALTAIAQTVATRLTVSCLDAAPRSSASGAPLCVVGDVPAATPGAVPARAMPACSATCCAAWAAAARPTVGDAGITAACRGEAAAPCYCARTSTATGVCAGGAVAGVWRADGAAAPDETVTSFVCAR